MKCFFLTVLILLLPTVVASQDSNPRSARSQYFSCAAVHTMMALLFEDDGDEAAEAKHNQIAADLFEEGKRDLAEVGKDPAEANARVQENWNRMLADPTQFRFMALVCKDHFPDRW